MFVGEARACSSPRPPGSRAGRPAAGCASRRTGLGHGNRPRRRDHPCPGRGCSWGRWRPVALGKGRIGVALEPVEVVEISLLAIQVFLHELRAVRLADAAQRRDGTVGGVHRARTDETGWRAGPCRWPALHRSGPCGARHGSPPGCRKPNPGRRGGDAQQQVRRLVEQAGIAHEHHHRPVPEVERVGEGTGPLEKPLP